MTISIAVIADTHLPTVQGTAQEAALLWALKRLRQEAPDVVVFAGDLTAVGDVASARRFRSLLDGYALPHMLMPGNSDLRTAQDADEVRRVLTGGRRFHVRDCTIVRLDSSAGGIPAADKQYLADILSDGSARNVVVITHLAPERLPEQDRTWFAEMLQHPAVRLAICAHRHFDRVDIVGDTEVHIIRGLDPDKAIGGPPAVTLFDHRDGRWSRRDLSFPGGDPSFWSEAVRDDFLAHLGVSCMLETLPNLAQAVRERVRMVEIRAAACLDVSRENLLRALELWRDAGGSYLSVHMPNLTWNAKSADIEGTEAWERSLELALELHAQALTVHPPRASLADMLCGGKAWQRFTDVFADSLRLALDSGMIAGFENLHLRKGEAIDQDRGFGCLPAECLEWVRNMRSATGCEALGMHLDIGHSRNNGALSSANTLGVWYALCGADITGYHLHQARIGPNGMSNHHPIEGLHGPLISLSSFLWAWETGQLRHAPMFLEIKPPEQCWKTLKRLREKILSACDRRDGNKG